MKFRTLIGMAVLAVSSLSLAQEVAFAQPPVPVESRSRAEVLAEFTLWRQTGLDLFHDEGADIDDVDLAPRTMRTSCR